MHEKIKWLRSRFKDMTKDNKKQKNNRKITAKILFHSGLAQNLLAIENPKRMESIPQFK